MIDERVKRFAEAYQTMAYRAKYRPQAPSDGCGHVCLSKKEAEDLARLGRECLEYGRAFAAEEDSGFGSFRVGYSNFETNRAFVWVIEAARQLAAGSSGSATALKLLKLAAAEVRDVQRGREV
jgi:hypothetical protein